MAEADSTQTTKMCPSCSVIKPTAEFNRSRRDPLGVAYECKACAAARSRAARTSDPAAHREKRRAHYQKNSDKIRAAATEKYQRIPAAGRLAAWRRSGIDLTWDRYLEMLDRQGGRCALCDKTQDANGKALAVDHDHQSGMVRGLLCDDCNIALGRFKDSPEILRRALHYLGNP